MNTDLRMSDDIMKLTHYASAHEVDNRMQMISMLKNAPMPDDQLLNNLGMFLESKNLARILFMSSLFEQIREVQGVVMEFGTHWGQNLALFSALRGIYDPFNRHRKIIGFDTFEGFPEIHSKDGDSEMMRKGQLATSANYVDFLRKIMDLQEKANPLSHIKKYEVVKGDATVQIKNYIKDNPETIVALAYFDFDLYEPTKACLEAIRPRLTKGSVVAFDELNDPDSPGETTALMEVLGLNNIRLKRPNYASRVSYFVVE